MEGEDISAMGRVGKSHLGSTSECVCFDTATPQKLLPDQARRLDRYSPSNSGRCGVIELWAADQRFAAIAQNLGVPSERIVS